MPNILHLSQSDLEGGANRAAFRIHRAMLDQGIWSVFHAGRKLSGDPSVHPAKPFWLGQKGTDVAAYLNARAIRAHGDRPPTPFSATQLCYGRLNSMLLRQSDVIVAHWISGGFLHPRQLAKANRPIIWRLSDIWPLSGGCHYPGDCVRYEAECGSCPQLASSNPYDLSHAGFLEKRAGYANLDLTIAAPSRWIAGLARRSSLFRDRRIEHIPTGVDLAVFAPQSRKEVRARLGLPADKPIMLFGALSSEDDPRKGYAHLIRTLEILSSRELDAVVVTFGGSDAGTAELIAGFETHRLGHVENEAELATIYSCADVFIAPFVEDNLPNVVLESLACGTPVAAFAAGGIPDAIDPQVNGMLAEIGACETLADGIEWLLGDEERRAGLRRESRNVAEDRFDLKNCVGRYLELAAELAERAGKGGRV